MLTFFLRYTSGILRQKLQIYHSLGWRSQDNFQIVRFYFVIRTSHVAFMGINFYNSLVKTVKTLNFQKLT